MRTSSRATEEVDRIWMNDEILLDTNSYLLKLLADGTSLRRDLKQSDSAIKASVEQLLDTASELTRHVQLMHSEMTQMRSEMNHQDSLIAMLKADIKECRGREMHKMKELKSAKNQLTQAAYQRTKLRQEISMLKRAAANEQNDSDERVASASDARSSTGTEPLLQSMACMDVGHKCYDKQSVTG